MSHIKSKTLLIDSHTGCEVIEYKINTSTNRAFLNRFSTTAGRNMKLAKLKLHLSQLNEYTKQLKVTV